MLHRITHGVLSLLRLNGKSALACPVTVSPWPTIRPCNFNVALVPDFLIGYWPHVASAVPPLDSKAHFWFHNSR